MVELRKTNDRLMTVKLVMEGLTLNTISGYAPQMGLDKEVKNTSRRIWIWWWKAYHILRSYSFGGDFNIYIKWTNSGFNYAYEVFGFRIRYGRGVLLLNFAKDFELMITNSYFSKEEEHSVTFSSAMVKTQIVYLLFQKDDKDLCKDYKVIISENLSTQ